jgi:hypothetical protein
VARPARRWRVTTVPRATCFKPAALPFRVLEEVALTVEEAEAIRLRAAGLGGAVKKEARRMATRVYFLIRSAAECDHGRDAEWIRDLEAMAEVQRVERVLGEYDLLATVAGAAPALQVAHKILANACVEQLAVRHSPTDRRPG